MVAAEHPVRFDKSGVPRLMRFPPHERAMQRIVGPSCIEAEMGAALRLDWSHGPSAEHVIDPGGVWTCFGIGCPSRQCCLRYQAVDTAPAQTTHQVTCAGRSHPGQSRYPDFIPIGVIGPGALRRQAQGSSLL